MTDKKKPETNENKRKTEKTKNEAVAIPILRPDQFEEDVSAEAAPPIDSAGEQAPSSKLINRAVRRRRSKARRFLDYLLLTIAAGLFFVFLYWVFSQLLVAFIAPSFLAERFSGKTSRPVTIARAEWQPFKMSLSLYNGIVGPPHDKPDDRIDPLMSFRSMHLAFRPLNRLLGKGPLLDRVEIVQPFFHLQRDRHYSYNLEPWLYPLLYGKHGRTLSLQRGRLVYTDQSLEPYFIDELRDIEAAITTLSPAADSPSLARLTLNGRVFEQGELSLVAMLPAPGEPLYRGDSEPLSLKLKNLPVQELAEYLEPSLGYGVVAGEFDLDARFSFNAPARVAVDQRLTLKGLRLSDQVPGGDPSQPDPRPLLKLLSDKERPLLLEMAFSFALMPAESRYLGSLIRRLEPLILKAEQSPWELLSDEFPDLNRKVAFNPGEYSLNKKAKEQLAGFASLLEQRPLISLTLNAQADTACDKTVLKDRKEQLHSQEIEKVREELNQRLAAGDTDLSGLMARLREPPPGVERSELLELAQKRQKAVEEHLAKLLGLSANQPELSRRLTSEEPEIVENLFEDSLDCASWVVLEL